MFCKNCGRKLSEQAAFCPQCGTAVAQGTQNDAPKKRGGALLAIVIIAVLLVFAAGAVAVLRHAAKGKPDTALRGEEETREEEAEEEEDAPVNQMELLYTAAEHLVTASAGDLSMKLSEGEWSARIYLSWLLGETIQTSALDMETKQDDGSRHRQILAGGSTAATNRWGDEIEVDDAAFFYTDSIPEDMEYIVAQGQLNAAEIFAMIDWRMLDDLNYDLDVDMDSEGFLRVMQDFLLRYCAEERVTEDFISELARTKSGGITTYTYTVSLYELLTTLDDYVQSTGRDSAYMAKNELDEDNLRALEALVEYVENELTYHSEDDFDGNLSILLSIDKRGRPAAFEFRTKYYDEWVKIDLTVENLGTTTLDAAALEAFVAEID